MDGLKYLSSAVMALTVTLGPVYLILVRSIEPLIFVWRGVVLRVIGYPSTPHLNTKEGSRLAGRLPEGISRPLQTPQMRQLNDLPIFRAGNPSLGMAHASGCPMDVS